MAETPKDWDAATRLVRGGLARSPHGEIAEALYLTQSYAYESAEAADARFSGAAPGFIYARYGNPTVAMFEQRLALLEGAEACKATASGMAAVFLAITGLLKSGDHVVAGRALFGSCRWILGAWAQRFGVETTFVDAPDIAAWRAAVRPNTKLFFLETPANPLLEICDVAAEARGRHRRLFGDQAYRRPGPGAGRRAAWRGGVARRSLQGSDAPHRPGDVAVQRLASAEGPGDAGSSRARAEPDGGGVG